MVLIMLGHAPSHVTLTYTHVSFEELKKAVDKLPTELPSIITDVAKKQSKGSHG